MIACPAPLRSALTIALLLTGLGSARGEECQANFAPSPGTDWQSRIAFHNDTNYAMRLLWVDFNGGLKDYGLLQPYENTGFKTYVGHNWVVEVYTEEGPECLGPISAPDQNGCNLHVVNDAGLGFNADQCDF
ncbi:VHL beta domain-containing protein [Oryzibacter oryziterrae]|uniref:VHL beta domain-containing protein n=1 Tax=Oryzibacter oryziterrae TaxID=2766474 RepID=UPI001F1F2AA4|nr:hypothetical protein [Oryzibacter oryziterrae]